MPTQTAKVFSPFPMPGSHRPAVWFELWDARTDRLIARIDDGGYVDPELVLHRPVNIVAVPADPASVESIFFDFKGERTRTENVYPYALFGDRRGDFNGSELELGEHSLSVTAYAQNRLKGSQVFSDTLTFVVGTPPLTIEIDDGSITEGKRTSDVRPIAVNAHATVTLSVETGGWSIVDGVLTRDAAADYDESAGGEQTETVIIRAENANGDSATARVAIAIENVVDTEEVLSGWISSLRYTTGDAEGAIPVSDGIAVYEDGTGTALQRVTPYFTHLGVLGLLEADAIPTAEQNVIAGAWLDWFVDHIDPAAGVPLDTWYSPDGAYGTTCPVAGDPVQCEFTDAADSSAALFLVAVETLLENEGGGDYAPAREDVRAVTDTLLALRDPGDGLFWAKQTYPVKFLMNNVEVLEGLRAAEAIERLHYGNASRAHEIAAYAAELEAALYDGGPGGLYDSDSGLFFTHKDGAGGRGVPDLDQWYPSMMAQIWPTVFGQVEHRHAYDQVHAAIEQTVGGESLTDGDCAALLTVTGQHAPALAYAMQLHDTPYALSLIECMADDVAPAFDWPFTVADAGWMLMADGDAFDFF